MTEDKRDGSVEEGGSQEGTRYSGPRRRRGRRGYEGQPDWKDSRTGESAANEPAPAFDARPDSDREPSRPEPAFVSEPRPREERPPRQDDAVTEPTPPREEAQPGPPREGRPRRGFERGRRGSYRREEPREGTRGEGQRRDMRRDEPRRDDMRRDEPRREDMRRDRVRSEDARREDRRREDTPREPFRRDEVVREDRGAAYREKPGREEPKGELPDEARREPRFEEGRREEPRREERRDVRPPAPRGGQDAGPTPREERPRRDRDRRGRERREPPPAGDTPRELRRDRAPRGERRPAPPPERGAAGPRGREGDRNAPNRSGGGRPSGPGGGRRPDAPRRGREGGGRHDRSRGSAASALADHPQKPTSALMMAPKPIRVMIVGGGTGGHITPALSIGEALKSRNPQTELLFIGSDRGMEREIIGQAGFRVEEFSLQGLPTRPSFAAVKQAVQMWVAYRSIRKLISEWKPDVVVGTGGYVTVPGALAARAARVPLVLQEQNSIPGKANRLLSRFASEVHIHFTESRRWFKDRGKLRLSGNPVRIRVPEGRGLKTLQKYRLQPDRKTVLILGGSQGAHSLNQAFIDMLPHFRNDRDVQFVIQTGKQDYGLVLNSVRDSAVRVVVKSFLHQIEEIYGITNLVVARAGAMTVSEISACGLPSILVPYPYAADDHQTANARALSDKGAAVLLRDQDVSGERMAQEIRKLLADSGRLREMGRFAYSLSRPDAARRIAESVERLGGGAPEMLLNMPEEYDENEEGEAEAKH